MAHPPSEVERIFHVAVELADAAARRAYAREACAGDAALLGEVEALLAAHEAAGSFMALGPHDEAAEKGTEARDPDSSGRREARGPAGGVIEGVGTLIGRYKLLQEIGEGGFGTVYMAEQREPVQRKVALKIIKLGMDTRQVIARFEQERQALALMDHPHIARVLDAGATETGRPYFVMELVAGEPITDYCDRNSLTIERRLGLYVQVCQAVQHAHSKAIIHRDIKPSNVLVSTHDGRPHAKVIDFGVAKATAARLTEKTLFTEHRQLIGTPQYMSPEQAEGSVDIDTRTDVYSLGVLLYELLTGVTPFDAKSLRAAALAEIQRIIREVEPSRPSTRLSTQKDTLARVAADRHIEARKLSALVRGDLDWIVMKALEKDRGRRYETANGLAMDVERHLAGEAVVAAPPSALYRARKFVRRHRGGVVAAALVATALTLGVVGTTTGMIWALREQAKARQQAGAAEIARVEEERQRKLAQESEARARSEALRSDQITGFLTKMLSGAGPAVAAGRDATVLRELLDESADQIEKELSDLAVQANLMISIAWIYRDLAVYDKAMIMADKALALERQLHPTDHPLLASALEVAGAIRMAVGQGAEADALFQQSLEMRQRVYQGDHREIVRVLTYLANRRMNDGNFDDAERHAEQGLAMTRRLYSGDHVDKAVALRILADIRHQQGRDADAEKLFREALELVDRLPVPDLTEVADILTGFGTSCLALGRPRDAEPLLERAVELQRKLNKSDHPSLSRSLGELATVRETQGRFEDAIPLRRESLAIDRRLFKGTHVQIAVGLNNLAYPLYQLGRSAEIEPLYEEALRIFERIHAGDHPHTASAMCNLATIQDNLGRTAEAEHMFQRALDMTRRIYPGDHPLVANVLSNLAYVRQNMGRAAEAEPLNREALAMRRRLVPGDSPRTAESLSNIAFNCCETERFTEAESLVSEALAMSKRLHDGDHPDTARCLSGLGRARDKARRHVEAEPLFEQALAMYRRLYKGGHLSIADALDSLGLCQLAQGRSGEALPKLESAFEMRTHLIKGDHRKLANSLNNLGWLHCVRGDYAAAEPLLRRAMEMRRKVLPENHPEIAATLNNLGVVLRAKNDAAGAEHLFAEALSVRQELLPAGHVDIALSRSELGAALADQGKHAESEALFRQAWVVLAEKDHGWLAEKLEITRRLVRLYQAWNLVEPGKGYNQKAAEWQVKLRALQLTKQPGTSQASQPATSGPAAPR